MYGKLTCLVVSLVVVLSVLACVADRTGLSDKRTVERIQDRLIEALKLQISRNHALEPNLFASILMKIPELRTLGAKHTDQLAWYRKHWLRLQLPPLFAEIYDVPKMEADFLNQGQGGPSLPMPPPPQQPSQGEGSPVASLPLPMAQAPSQQQQQQHAHLPVPT